MQVRVMPVLSLGRRAAYKALSMLPGTQALLGVSGQHKVISRDDALNAQCEGWLEGLTARRQAAAYNDLMACMHRGDVRIDLDVAARGIRKAGMEKPTILEIGCGNGYYAEVFETLLREPFAYVGTDYSDAMIETARARYPDHRFEVANACGLKFEDSAFDIVFNGVSLMHILDFETAIRESARVAGSHCLYHSVPVFTDRDTTYLRKYAYGSPVVEVVFNRDHLLGIFKDAGLTLVEYWESIPYDVYPATPQHSTTETFLLKVDAPVMSSNM
jgi:SAM-dependent methyltransferase